MPEDLDEREKNHWWKAKKWAYANLNRLFVRYGNPQTLGKSSEVDYTEVAKYFISHFAPEILKTYLVQVEKWVGKTLWLSRAALNQTLTFLDECIKPKSTWELLKPHTDSLLEHLVFPVLCQTDEDLELFEDEPQEYLHRKLNYYEETSAPDVAATNFLVTLTKNRRKQTYSVLNFINNVVNTYEAAPENEKDPRRKEGALRMIGTLSSVILGKKSPIADQVEYFFVRHVFPEFRSPHGFLRARACDTLEKFEALDFKDPNNLILIYKNILECMADPTLPVRVSASLALQPLIRHDIIRENMKQNIPQVMQQLLKLANEVDVDALANVMEDFVEVFAAELTPFAVALSEQLRDTYLRIVSELLARHRENDDSEYGDFLDEKSITALGVLQTIGTLILTLESTPDVLHHLETILMPVITVTLENKLYGTHLHKNNRSGAFSVDLFADLYNEVFEIIDSCTFAAKSISPTMWQAFELIHRTFKAGAELYLEGESTCNIWSETECLLFTDMLPALENYVNYGTETLVQNRAYLDAIVDMIRTIFKDDKVGGVDRICGCKLAEIIMLNMRGQVDDYVPEFIGLASNILFNEEPKVKSLKIHLMEVIVNGIYYNAPLTLHVLENNGWTNKFFSQWFASIDSFTRVHDKKLCIAAISALLTLNVQSVPVSVQQGWPRLLQGIVRLFQTLPAALKNREEAKKEEAYDYDDATYDDDDEEWAQEVDWSNEGEDETEDIKDESQAYLDFLNEEVCSHTPVSTVAWINCFNRHRSSALMTMMMSSRRKVSSRRPSTRSSPTPCSSTPSCVRTSRRYTIITNDANSTTQSSSRNSPASTVASRRSSARRRSRSWNRPCSTPTKSNSSPSRPLPRPPLRHSSAEPVEDNGLIPHFLSFCCCFAVASLLLCWHSFSISLGRSIMCVWRWGGSLLLFCVWGRSEWGRKKGKGRRWGRRGESKEKYRYGYGYVLVWAGCIPRLLLDLDRKSSLFRFNLLEDLACSNYGWFGIQ